MNVYDYLFASARAADTSVIGRHESVTYGELVGMAERVGQILQRAGITRGERVGVFADNSAFWVACYLGILKIGAVAALFPRWLSAQQMVSLVERTQTRAICMDSARISQHGERLPEGPQIVTPGMTLSGQAARTRAPHVTDGFMPTPAEAGAAAVEDQTDLAALMFMSGSTAAPNAVEVSHDTIMANTTSIVESLGLARDDRMLVFLPFDSDFGLSLFHAHLRVGATLVLNKASQLSEDVLDDMEHFGCTGLAGVPAIYQELPRRSSLPRRALTHWRYALQAGGELADGLVAEFGAALPHVRLFVMYAQTEAPSPLSSPLSQRPSDRLGSISGGTADVWLQRVDPATEGKHMPHGDWEPDIATDSLGDGEPDTGRL